jgi:hypothetical protein
MRNLSHVLATLLATAWAGGLWATGYLAVPILFYAQPDKQLAGMLAGQMFAMMGYVGMVCGIYLLVQCFIEFRQIALRKPLFWITAVMLLLTLVIQFVIQPMMSDLKTQALPLEVMHSTFSDRFKMLHGISSIIYLIQSLLGVALVIMSNRVSWPNKKNR